MLINVLLSLVQSLIMYIITSTIVNQGNTQNQNYFKAQVEELKSTMTNATINQQANLINELKTMRESILNETKEQGATVKEVLLNHDEEKK